MFVIHEKLNMVYLRINLKIIIDYGIIGLKGTQWYAQESMAYTEVGGRRTIEFTVKGPAKPELKGFSGLSVGCASIDIIFKAPVEVGEITFRNYYTASLDLLVKRVSSEDKKGAKIRSARNWEISICHKDLMASPHLENGSQDTVSIVATESRIEWKDVIGMRLVLRQPSHLWKAFHVDDITIYTDLPRLKQSAAASSARQETDRLLNLFKQQTIDALMWSPINDLRPVSSPRNVTPREHYKNMSGYEIAKLPIS